MKKTLIKVVNSIKVKLSEKAGETIVETLASMLIVVLAFMMLAGAIVASAKVNASTEKHTMFLNLADTDTDTIKELTGKTVYITTPSGTINTGKNVKTYTMKDSSGILYFYE